MVPYVARRHVTKTSLEICRAELFWRPLDPTRHTGPSCAPLRRPFRVMKKKAHNNSYRNRGAWNNYLHVVYFLHPPSSAEEVVQPAISSLSAIPAAPTADRFPSVSSHIDPVVMLDPSEREEL